MVKGEKRNDAELSFRKYVGIENLKPIRFNPDKQELEGILSTELEDEPEYTGKEDRDGNRMSFISVWLLGEKTGVKFNLRFILIDKERVSKAGQTQFINSIGQTSYSDSPENLPRFIQFFTDKKNNDEIIGDKAVRVARVGEEELYNFLRSWVRIKYSVPGAELSFDFDRLMRGDVRELNDLINTDLVETVVGVAIVKNVEKDGETRQYQGISTRAFLPGNCFKYVMLGAFPKFLRTSWAKFQEAFTGEYGEKAQFSLDVIHEYDETSDITASNDTRRDNVEESSPNY